MDFRGEEDFNYGKFDTNRKIRFDCIIENLLNNNNLEIRKELNNNDL